MWVGTDGEDGHGNGVLDGGTKEMWVVGTTMVGGFRI